MEIESRLNREVGNDYLGHKSTADTLLEQKRKIDKQYARFMLKAERAPGCCAAPSQDLIVKHFCSLVLYRRSNKTAVADFLKDVALTKESAVSLWEIDEIVFASHEHSAMAVPFGPYGPVENYLSDLSQLVFAGNTEALRNFLALYTFATGEYREGLEDDAEKLFLNHPEIVAKNWQLIRSHREVLSDLAEMIPSDAKAKALPKIRHQCDALGHSCDEIDAMLR